MILFLIIINTITWAYVWYDYKVKKPVKIEMNETYINGLIEKALRETENDIK